MSRREQIAGELTEQLEQARQERALIDGLIDWLDRAIRELDPSRAPVNGTGLVMGPGELQRIIVDTLKASERPLSVREISERISGPAETTVRNTVYGLVEGGLVEEAGEGGTRGAMTYRGA